MYCTSCGHQNEDNARFCGDCGQELRWATTPTGRAEIPEQIPNYLAWAILVTIFCCSPFGIVSIVYAAQVNGKLAAGDIVGARQASTNARTWAWVAFGVSAGLVVAYIVFSILASGVSLIPELMSEL